MEEARAEGGEFSLWCREGLSRGFLEEVGLKGA